MSRVKGYDTFNESRRHRNKGGKRSPNNNRGVIFPGLVVSGNDKPLPSSLNRGIPMHFSQNFEYIVKKLASKNNAISKDLLELLNKKDAKFEYSYIDLTPDDDSLSYIQANQNKDIPEDQKFTSSKRQRSKVYKVIKTIFQSKYTKVDVNKFVSMYKTVYKQGPEKKETVKPKQTNDQLLKQVTKDTKEGKLKWELVHDSSDMSKYTAKFNITTHKRVLFEFYHFRSKEDLCFMCIFIFNDLGTTEKEQRIFYKNIPFREIQDFIVEFIIKYDIK